MATNYERAQQALAQADHVSDHPNAQRIYRDEALVFATLAIADELSGLVAEVKGLRHELHKLREQRALKSA